ncbi:decaprenylphosphoryl-beta-D-ribose oxidase [Streptacidiphilus pinicola]|uniref:Decaprenylphosphoryl-beta-D-ribose oxidase n=1 Tax=Streptacidiphilus pinicola TaxID=2219663 RepID=A0A2X0IC87_9ACTN|nr:FAD-binding oxidoreductase [Streptacidiphilus pinicola]RAG81203.1 decaprenylphosphoryl-beta-D-ribose oxidase [Streptacidiphilus pinicola]
MAEPEVLLSGWGRTPRSRAEPVGPLSLPALRGLIASRPERGLVARGAGRSYGDAALNSGGLVLTQAVEPWLLLDPHRGRVRVSASVEFTELLARTVPHGWLPPVLPGTAHLTVGGAVAADVHGKNQHRDGTIAAWLDQIDLVDGTGTLRRLTPEETPHAFGATVGGMGLTGVIVSVTLRLLPIRSALLDVTTRRAADLDALMDTLDTARSRYAVAWIDGTAHGRSLGRGVVDLADHHAEPDPRREPDGPRYRPGLALPVPALPFCPVTPRTAAAFNGLWYHRAPRLRQSVATLGTFFHRLDALAGWNRALGPAGIWQYQFVVPDAERDLVVCALETLHRHQASPFLGTLKRFGPADGHPLSFPVAGWSLAVDLPAARAGIGELLDALDRLVAKSGGRLYLAKDARMDRARFTEMYGPLDAWHEARARLDPHGVFRSDLGRRLGLCE